MCNAFKFYKDNIEFTNSTSSFNLFNNLASTKTINMGGAGTINISNLAKLSRSGEMPPELMQIFNVR